MGATHPKQAIRLREIIGKAPFLIPGYGTQGGSPNTVVHGFVKGPYGFEGGIISSSRKLLFPEKGYIETSTIWEIAFDDMINKTINELKNSFIV